MNFLIIFKVNTRESRVEIGICHDSWAEVRMNSLVIMVYELFSNVLFESILRCNRQETNGGELRSHVMTRHVIRLSQWFF